ncbi:MAG: PilZ domain-containing protein [Candidatus Acidiferrum sp.]
MQSKRRSGRIAKEIAIVLLGTDTAGKVFSEETKTVLLSRHGAGVVSRYRFTPDEVLTLRLPGTTKEAAVRLVGQMGGEPGRYVYGLAFVDPDPDFWPIQFPPPEPYEPAIPRFLLQCSFCEARQEVEQGDIEEDVYSVLGNVLRYCQECGTSTPWKKTSSEAVPSPIADPAKPNFNSQTPTPSPNTLATRPGSPAPLHHPSFEPEHAALCPPVLAPQAASYSGEFAIQEFTSIGDIQDSPQVATSIAVLHPSETAEHLPLPAAKPPDPHLRGLDANGRRINKRRHVRIRVSFTACVRDSGHADEIVECENVSKGGICFRSLKRYAMDSLIEIAAPFSPGEPPLFISAQIKRMEPLSGGKVFRYGAEYTFRPPSRHF